jgi:hypothetical protein
MRVSVRVRASNGSEYRGEVSTGRGLSALGLYVDQKRD